MNLKSLKTNLYDEEKKIDMGKYDIQLDGDAEMDIVVVPKKHRPYVKIEGYEANIL